MADRRWRRPEVARRLASVMGLLTALAGCSGASEQGAANAPPSSKAAASAAANAPSAAQLSVSGVVRGPDGKPVGGALVAVIDIENAESVGQAHTSAEGRFRIAGLKPGQYGLSATAPGMVAAEHAPFDLAAGQSLDGRDITLGAKGFTLRGVVRRANGQPASRVNVRAFCGSEVGLFIATTDERGAYTMTLPENRYALDVSVPGEMSPPTRIHEPRDRTLDLDLAIDFPPEQPPPAEALAWLKQNAIPLTTVEAGHGFTDLAPLRDVVGKARVVALGEATHGTREFFQLKNRLIEYLVTELGFTALAIEANMADVRMLDAYVLTGKGDPASAVMGTRLIVWNTEEVVALARWMRMYNEDPAHTRKLRVYGFDMQDPSSAALALLDDIRRMDPGLAAEASKLLAPVDSAFEAESFWYIPLSQRQEVVPGIDRLIKQIDEKKDAYEKRVGARTYALARLTAQTILQRLALGATIASAMDARDRAMADNARALLDLEGPGARMILWAHNGHITRETADPRMGKYLHEALGADYVNFELTFGSGSFRAADMHPEAGQAFRSFTWDTLPPGTLDGALAQVGRPLFALDMRRAPAGSVASSWLASPLQTKSVGWGFSEAMRQAMLAREAPSKGFDALLYVHETTAAQPNARAPISPRQPPPAKSKALVNPGLEEGMTGEAPAGWTLTGLAYRAEITEQRPHGGKRAASLSFVKPELPRYMGKLVQQLDVAPYRGKRVKVRAFARAEVKGQGNEAALYLMARVPQANALLPPALFVSTREPITASAWKEQTLEGTIPKDAEELSLGFVLSGEGRAFLDDVSIDVMDEAKP